MQLLEVADLIAEDRGALELERLGGREHLGAQLLDGRGKIAERRVGGGRELARLVLERSGDLADRLDDRLWGDAVGPVVLALQLSPASGFVLSV